MSPKIVAVAVPEQSDSVGDPVSSVAEEDGLHREGLLY
jgi:hypothetical protein